MKPLCLRLGVHARLPLVFLLLTPTLASALPRVGCLRNAVLQLDSAAQPEADLDLPFCLEAASAFDSTAAITLSDGNAAWDALSRAADIAAGAMRDYGHARASAS